MQPFEVSFLDPYGPPDRGVDHLGMRVAGEAAYSKLIDFITTVAWRPRYFSFLCWSLQKAWEASANKSKDGVIRVNRTLQRSILKRLDYLVAASTLLIDGTAQRIAGSDAITKKLIEPNKTTVEVREDHLSSSGGSYNIYVGSMRSLGLVETASNVDRPSIVGKKLAEFYKESLGDKEDMLISAVRDKAAFSADELKTLAKIAGLTAFNNDAMPNAVAAEKLALRELFFGPSTPLKRRLSAGIILRAHEFLHRKVSLDEFRSLTLLQGLQTQNGGVEFSLPKAYKSIIQYWAGYQAHAYATYSLEALLGIVIRHAHLLETHRGEGVDNSQLINHVLDIIKHNEGVQFGRREDMGDWWDMDMRLLRELVLNDIEKTYKAEMCEPTLYAALKSTPDSENASLLLFIYSVVRLETLQIKYGDASWIGSQDPFRLPPKVLIATFREAIDKNIKAEEYVRYIISQYVIKQHYYNAMRKLAAVPKIDTSKFSWEGDRLVPNGSHIPGTSNPRFENAVFCLNDLGYLNSKGEVTEDGFALLREIEDQLK